MSRRRLILVNAVSAKMGGAVKYVEAIAETIARGTWQYDWRFVVPGAVGRSILRKAPNSSVITTEAGEKANWRRIVYDQVTLRNLANRRDCAALLSAGNVALIGSPCLQLLLVRNALFFSRTYRRRILPKKPLRTRGGEGARRLMAMVSIAATDVVMVPSMTMRDELLEDCPNAAAKTVVNVYGVVPPPNIGRPWRGQEGGQPVRLFFPGLYAEHKNLGTLMGAVECLADDGMRCMLVTPADPRREGDRSSAARREADIASRLDRMGVAEFKPMLSREAMALEYETADIVVYPSVVESFGHPLVEAMAVGVAVVASDVPINREICGNAAFYFSPYDPKSCAEAIRKAITDREGRAGVVKLGKERAAAFSWEKHVERIEELVGTRGLPEE